jgi:HD-like signal output (HDOD) protein
LAVKSYDAVVTDLRMPNMHGHALIVELLQKNPRPAIVVHTAVDEPRLTRDLVMRGVDDIYFKPVRMNELVANVKERALQRRESGALQPGGDQRPDNVVRGSVGLRIPDDLIVPLSEIEEKVSLIARILPVSEDARTIFDMTCTGCDTSALATAIRCRPELAEKVLAIANGRLHNPAGTAIRDLDQAVIRVGQRRIGEFAIGSAIGSALTRCSVSWMNMDELWRQSVAASVAVEYLINQGRHRAIENSLSFVAMMNALGRIVLGTLYPHYYRSLLAQCDASGGSLIEAEQRVFPENHAKIMARLLAAWSLPPQMSEPLSHLLDA